ncbi:MAG: zinc ribbon domain-containing protein [Calditrichaeota bacterium]|nr:zinc ribbon domain-containing protein [Calditrichota bacterium]
MGANQSVPDESLDSYICSDCGAEVSIDAEICPNCGADLSEIEEEKIESSSENDGQKYPALRTISGIYKVLAWITGIGAVITLFYGFTLLGKGYSAKTTGISLITSSLIMGILGVIAFLAISEGIKLFIDIESNSREQISLLNKMLEKK